MTNCTVTGNQGSNNTAVGGGGVLVANGATLSIPPDCRATHHTATELYDVITNKGAVELQGNSPATLAVNNCPDNGQTVPGCTENQIDCPN